MGRALLVLGLLASSGAAQADDSIRANRRWDVLDRPRGAGGHRRVLEQAARRLGAWAFDFAGARVDGTALLRVARTEEPLRRGLRERLGQAVDLHDFLLFVDDLLRAREVGRVDAVTITSGRARAAGILIHPEEIFANGRRRYGRQSRIRVDPPPESDLRLDGSRARRLGPLWTAAFLQPETEGEHFEALRALNADFAARLEHLFRQLRLQGADVVVNATVRPRERGYLIYGAYVLGRCRSQSAVRRRIRELNVMRRRHDLDVGVLWRHPDGWRGTVRAARRMADTYGVVFATRWGALESDHYVGDAIDFEATNLPRWLALTSYDGTQHRMFDLRDPVEPRDLALTPRLVAWVEEAYGFEKLSRDYPHWSDAR